MTTAKPALPWMEEALKFNGLREIKGPMHHPTIVGWLRTLKAWYFDDETPWCGTFVAIVFRTVGYSIPKLYMRAKEWATWGVPLTKPTVGCVGVMDRQGGGHVTFIVGRTKDGYYVGYGGNQGDMVKHSKFHPDRFIAFRWPKEYAVPLRLSLPLVEVTGNVSTNEA